MIMAPWSGSGILKILDDNLCDVVNNFNNNACSYKFILGGREGGRERYFNVGLQEGCFTLIIVVSLLWIHNGFIE